MSAETALREDLGRFLRRVGGLTVEFRDGKAFLPVRDDWVGDLEAGYRAALAARPDSPTLDVERLRAAVTSVDHATPGAGWVEDVVRVYADEAGYATLPDGREFPVGRGRYVTVRPAICPACGSDARHDFWTVGDDSYACARSAVPVGAYVAAALMAANYPGDSGEDVDRFLNELEALGYAVVPLKVALAADAPERPA